MRTLRSRSVLTAALIQVGPLTIFTLVAIFGYLVFVVPPWGARNLARVAHFEWIPTFYASSFNFFAQAHILIGAVVLIAFLAGKSRARWMVAFVVVYAVSLAAELIGTGTGLPFGHYSYSTLLGPKWFGLVPVLIPVSWFLMAIPSYLIAADRYSGWMQRVAFGATLLTAWDLALDPAMSYITSYWSWEESGVYYGMPLLNLVGWFATGFVLMVALELIGTDRIGSKRTTVWMSVYYVVTVLLPVGMIAAAGVWPAALLTIAVVGLLLAGNRFRRDEAASSLEIVPDLSISQAAGLASIPVDLQDYFHQNSRSFSFAARFFSDRDRERVRRLYAFCRLTDDLVDETAEPNPPATNGSSSLNSEHSRNGSDMRTRTVLSAWKSLSEASFNGRRSGAPWLDTLMAQTRESGAPFSLVEQLFAGVESDLGHVRIASDAELDEYAYKVGSVVGVWMCYLLGVRSDRMHEYAADLGRAMQITNILRDVGEDLDADRIYLPATLLGEFEITEADLRAMRSSGEPSEAYVALIRRLMQRAEDLYERAWIGLARLPRSFGTAAAVASGVYRGILREIERNDFDNFGRRARTSSARKIYLALQSRLRLHEARKRQIPRLDCEPARPKEAASTSVQQLADEYNA